MNRTGDMVLSVGFFALFGLFGTLNYESIFALAPNANKIAITIIALFLIGGSLAKSAQIPLHSWLPGSMEAWIFFFYINILLLLTLYIL
jgi:NADH-ubiquinone oxidoreductase chain 5